MRIYNQHLYALYCLLLEFKLSEVKMEQPTLWIGTELICSKALTCLSVPYPQCGILLQGLNKDI
jgi:hypothetical protein